jgi:hypothetical protein
VKSEIWWYSARVGGAVVWALLAGALLSPVALSSRILAKRLAGGTVFALQRVLTATALFFTGLHLVGMVLAEQVNLDAPDVVVPLRAPEQPAAVAWGMVAAALVVAVTVASFVFGHADRRVWFVAHLASLVAFIAGTTHALGVSGPDLEHPVAWWASALGAAAIVGATIARLAVNGNPFAAVAAVDAVPPAPQGSIEHELERRERAIVAQLRGDADRPDSMLLQRTLAGLRSLDDRAPRAGNGEVRSPFDALVPPSVGEHATLVVPSSDERRPMVDPEDLGPTAGAPAPLPLTPSQAVSGSLFPSTEDLRQLAGPLDLTVPPGLHEHLPEPAIWDAAPVTAGGATVAPSTAQTLRDLPVRTPRRLARTTAAADRLDAWQPARATLAPSVGPPSPPTAIDPVTGEPDPTAYRQWLKDWLAYVESQG